MGRHKLIQSCAVCGETPTQRREDLGLCDEHAQIFDVSRVKDAVRRVAAKFNDVTITDWIDTNVAAKKFENSRLPSDTVDRWLAGESPKILAAEHGMTPSKFRRLARASTPHRPAKGELFGGKRAARTKKIKTESGAEIEVSLNDDSNVPIMTAETARPWTSRRNWGDPIFFDPSTETEWVRAAANQPAELIYAHDILGIPWIRLRRYEGSPVARKEKREAKVLAQGIEAKAAKKNAKKRIRGAK